MCHRMLRCPVCDLVYADNPPAESVLAESYHSASYDSSEEADDAAKAYVIAIQRALDKLATRESALEIGTGTGIFLKYLKDLGFSKLVGVEPSRAAIDAATPECRQWIREGMFNEQDFDTESFDLICCFMTMEHVRDPMEIAKSALRLLKPGGVFVTVTHDYRSPVNRFLGKHSPIVDIEHLQIFSKKAIEELFARAGFVNGSAKSFINRYSVRYWIRLSPLSPGIKAFLGDLFCKPVFSRIRLSINVGNTLACGYKPK
ncbi:MAG: class I SAM-dependent methyltransferase [Verrucomicrobia bacterium]|nr:class I SAM-dependent methyltransferase [Verrucomicrobiota bacterium]